MNNNNGSQGDTNALYVTLMDSWLPTGYLTEAALTGYGHTIQPCNTILVPLWQGIAGTWEEARDYYNSLDAEERRSEAASLLAADGWTVSDVARRKA